MPERDKDLDQSDLPPIVPARDELEQRQRGRGVGGNANPPQDKEVKIGSNPTIVSHNIGFATGFAKVLGSVFLVLLVVMAMFSAWLYLELLESRQDLESVNVRVLKLEDRLSSTDETMSQSSVEMQIKLKDLSEKTEKLWAQMDKLWASAWRRNQSEIGGLKKDIEAHIADLKAMQGSIAAVKKQSTSMSTQTKGIVSSQAKLEARVKKSEQALKVVKAMDKRVAKVEAAAKVQSNKQAALDKRVKDNEGWIEANNTHRQQVNRRIDQLNRSVKSLESATGTTAP